MLIKVIRKWFNKNCTIGLMVVDGVTQCYTLEDTARPAGIKVQNETCIPPGEYPVIMDMSQRFGKVMPHILNVPNFEGIRIHSGNTDKATEGCILVGLDHQTDAVLRSHEAFDAVYTKISAAADKHEPICLVVTNKPI